MTTKGTFSCSLSDRNSHKLSTEIARIIQLREIERLVHVTYLVNVVPLIVQLHDERACVLTQQLHVIECDLEHIVVEILDDVFGHVENGKSDEEWFHHFPHLCIQFDTIQILGIHGSPYGHIVPMLLDDSFAFIPCGGELYFHSIQPSFHQFAICRVCQQLVQVLLHSGLGFGSFLIQQVHIFEYEWSMFQGCVCQTL